MRRSRSRWQTKAMPPAPTPSTQPPDLADLVERWGNAVTRVGVDDRTMPEDVVAFLFIRDKIQEAFVEGSSATQANLDAVLAPLDEEYRTRTRPHERGMTTFVSRHGAGWWWHRVPKQMGAYFRARLEE